MSSGYHIIPKLVEDTSLKRSRIELQDGSTAIKVSEAAPADLSPVTDTLGETGDAAWSGTGDATVISLLKEIYDKLDNYSKVPIAVKITDKAGVPATYVGTYNGSSTLSTSSSQIRMIYGDKGTYYDVVCMAPDQSWTPGSSFTGSRIYRANIGSGSFSNRFTLLDENDTPLLDLADSSYDGAADTHLWIHKAMLVLDLPTN